MAQHYRDTIKHGGIYGFGQILGRLASLLLLPLYTRYLSPADYGIIAILDVTTGVLGVLLGAGMAHAVSRYHFEAQSADQYGEVWWTGLGVVVAFSTVLVAPAVAGRGLLATLTIGTQEPSGGYFYLLVLLTVWFGTIGQIGDQYMRIRKWSALTVALSFTFLILNISLNVYFLTVRHLGITGYLWGNLLTGVASMLVRCGILLATCQPIRFRWTLARKLLAFGSPLVAVAILSAFMHEADRYLLRPFVDLNQVGVYALAYTIGQGVNNFVITSFFSVWDVVVLEIAEQPEARRVYVLVFEYFAEGLLLVMLGVSLFAQPVLDLLVPPAFAPAGQLIPIVCLAFFFFALHAHFKVPAILAKKTGSIVVSPAIAAAANVVLNLLLIPIMGVVAAALVSVATYAIYSFVGLLQYRRFDRLDYPFGRVGAVLAAMIVSYIVCLSVTRAGAPQVWSLMLRAAVWSAWALGLAYPLVKRPVAVQALAMPS
jgi:O-antigen/teichoic acid export membrane protein